MAFLNAGSCVFNFFFLDVFFFLGLGLALFLFFLVNAFANLLVADIFLVDEDLDGIDAAFDTFFLF